MSVISCAMDASRLAMGLATTTVDNETTAKGIPAKYEGYLLKKKKWPLKGWHRRYFLLENGFLRYAKNPHGITKNKLHGLMDMGMSVMSTKKNALTIDLDAEDTIFHLKVKSTSLYQLWMAKLRLHRDFRLQELKKDSTLVQTGHPGADSLQSPVTPLSSEELSSQDSDRTLQSCNKGLNKTQVEIWALEKMLSELQSATSNMVTTVLTMPPPPSPSLSKKEKEKKSKKSKKSHKLNVNLVSTDSGTALSLEAHATSTPNFLAADQFKIPSSVETMHNLSRSNPDLTSIGKQSEQSLNINDTWSQRKSKMSSSVRSTPSRAPAARPATFSVSSSTANTLTNSLNDLTDKQNKFLSIATNVQKSLAVVLENIKNLDEMYQNQPKLSVLKSTISQLNSENSELRSRLHRIHVDSSPTDAFISPRESVLKRKHTSKTITNQFLSGSQLSITETTSEMFYDAEEYLLSDEESSSDEESETGDDEISSDAELSDESETTSTQSLPFEVVEITLPGEVTSATGRRAKLPCHRPDTDVSLWNILKKNIGKDLSKVAMPVTLNEPLNALQILCEELEYSSLLDKANSCDDIYEQLVYVSAFAISSYASTYTRAGQKPFNPILGETYECVREDKSFRFVAEQVSHHPPISVCHCDGENFEFWQDSRFKNKFWGKSLEVFPIGSVHVRLKRHCREFRWKKVTSCVHNIISGTRWIEHYGDMHVTCGELSCKVVFSKSGYWNNKNGEVSGTIVDMDGMVRHKLHGKWYESVHCDMAGKTKTVWRANTMPSDYEKQYGFTRFAVELNELTTDMKTVLPRTDSRFRPDQRCLEDGDVPGAEREKLRVEQLQREQKKQRDAQNIQYEPLFFTKVNVESDEDTWMFKGDYWITRQDPGFHKFHKLPVLW